MFKHLCLMALSLLLLASIPRSSMAAPLTPILVTVQSPCTETEFNAALAALPDGSNGLIKFNCGASPTTIALTTSKMVGEWGKFFDSPMILEIDGEGLITLTGVDAPPLFVNQSGSLMLRNLTIREASHGAVVAQSNAQLLVDNCDLLLNTNTTAPGLGGAISSINATVTIQNSRLAQNSAIQGGAIYTEGPLQVINTSIYSNTATQDGGAIYTTNPLDVSNSQIYSNTAAQYGGGVWSSNTTSFDNVRVSDNVVNDSNGEGAGLYGNGDLAVLGGQFYANRAPYEGGAINWDGPIDISGTLFYTNTARDGGAIFMVGTLHPNMAVNITNTQFLTNAASYDGGALFAKASVDLRAYDSVFRANRAGRYGGALGSGTTTVDLNLYRSVFTGNKAVQQGGAICSRGWLYGGLVTFNDNEAMGGGAVAAFTLVQFWNSQFFNNKASLRGGALYAMADTWAEDTTFRGNQSGDKGGAVYVEPNSAADYGDMKSSTFQQNSAVYGGAIYAATATRLRVNTSWLISNTASVDGGGIYSDYSSFAVSARNSQFTGNTATGNGGAFALMNGIGLLAERLTFNGNSASSGGALYTTGSNDLRNNLTFSGNHATQGGALYAASGDAQLMNATFYNNTASVSGGAIYIPNLVGAGQVTVTATILASATGGNCGGAPLAAINGNLATDSTCGGEVVTKQALALWPLSANGGTGLGVALASPMLTHRPKSGSVAIDHLFGTAGVDYWGQDQRGINRPYGLGADVGAVEVGPNDIDSTVYVPLIRR